MVMATGDDQDRMVTVLAPVTEIQDRVGSERGFEPVP
jgi:hypothetical protein